MQLHMIGTCRYRMLSDQGMTIMKARFEKNTQRLMYFFLPSNVNKCAGIPWEMMKKSNVDAPDTLEQGYPRTMCEKVKCPIFIMKLWGMCGFLLKKSFGSICSYMGCSP